jgi:hypothetical protein
MKYIYVSLLLLFFLSACKKVIQEPKSPPVQGIDLSINYKVDINNFSSEQEYINAAGYSYSVTKLAYYLSEINLIRPDSSRLLIREYLYFDAFSSAGALALKNIPEGSYIGMSFNIGLDSVHNTTDALPANPENIIMQWPDAMGGGYHFLRLEGYFKDAGIKYGYAMHIGTNACLVPVKLFKPISIVKDTKTAVNMTMNINEWFRNPNVFDFNTDGNYIMGNETLMKKFAENGRDVFSW